MFVRYFVDLDCPFDVIQAALLGDPERWIPGMAITAEAHGESLLAEVGFGETLRVQKRVRIELGTPIQLAEKLVLPIAWRSDPDPGFFPALEGDLEAAPMGSRRSQLAMTARYTPPFGLMGRAADRALFNRVAEATVRDFVDRVADALRRELVPN